MKFNNINTQQDYNNTVSKYAYKYNTTIKDAKLAVNQHLTKSKDGTVISIDHYGLMA